MKGYRKTYNQVKYLFAILKLFLNETAFYAKLLEQFLSSIVEVMKPIASKFGTNIHRINLYFLTTLLLFR